MSHYSFIVRKVLPSEFEMRKALSPDRTAHIPPRSSGTSWWCSRSSSWRTGAAWGNARRTRTGTLYNTSGRWLSGSLDSAGRTSQSPWQRLPPGRSAGSTTTGRISDVVDHTHGPAPGLYTILYKPFCPSQCWALRKHNESSFVLERKRTQLRSKMRSQRTQFKV